MLFAQIETNIVHRPTVLATYSLLLFYPHEFFCFTCCQLLFLAKNEESNRILECSLAAARGPTRKHEFLDIHRIDRGDPTIFRLPPITGPLLKEMRTQCHVK